MDRRIEKKKGIRAAFSRKALPYWGGGLLLIFILWLVFRDNSSTLRVDGDTITTGDVTAGEFNDYIRISGQVQPMTTIQISPLEGGVVKKSSPKKAHMSRRGTKSSGSAMKTLTCRSSTRRLNLPKRRIY